MARKPMYDGGTKNKMIEVATTQFFKKGFDGTSIRSIVDEVDCEVGLFYYYYKNKDELFTDVIDNFFLEYCKKADVIIEEVKKSTDKALMKFFMFLHENVNEFRKNYANNLHKTVLWAIRERALTYIEPYIEQIVTLIVEAGGKPMMDIHTTAIFLSHGVGSIMLHEDSEWILSVTNDLRKTINTIMGLSPEKAKEMFE